MLHYYACWNEQYRYGQLHGFTSTATTIPSYFYQPDAPPIGQTRIQTAIQATMPRRMGKDHIDHPRASRLPPTPAHNHCRRQVA